MVRGHRPGSGSVDLPKSNWVWTDVLHPFWRGFLSVVLGDWGLWAGGQKLWLLLRVGFLLQKTGVSFLAFGFPFVLTDSSFFTLVQLLAALCLVDLNCIATLWARWLRPLLLGLAAVLAAGLAAGGGRGVFVLLVGSSSSREPLSLSLPIPFLFFLMSFSVRFWLGGGVAGQVLGWATCLVLGRLPGLSSGWASVSSLFSPTFRELKRVFNGICS